MNLVALFSGEAYNAICEFLGANWYALVATMGLAGLAVVHIVYAFILNFQNRKARGNDAYVVNSIPKGVSFASQNMFVLGLIVLVFLVIHLYHFWAKMQLVEILHMVDSSVDYSKATNGVYWIAKTFANPVNVVLYLIGFGALWFHLTHGFWSALQTIGINNQVWFNRWKWIGTIWATVVMLGYTIVVLAFFIFQKHFFTMYVWV
jgi:succinate dehydrogenase / fumarate reductase cytochrome b subunit